MQPFIMFTSNLFLVLAIFHCENKEKLISCPAIFTLNGIGSVKLSDENVKMSNIS